MLGLSVFPLSIELRHGLQHRMFNVRTWYFFSVRIHTGAWRLCWPRKKRRHFSWKIVSITPHLSQRLYLVLTGAAISVSKAEVMDTKSFDSPCPLLSNRTIPKGIIQLASAALKKHGIGNQNSGILLFCQQKSGIYDELLFNCYSVFKILLKRCPFTQWNLI